MTAAMSAPGAAPAAPGRCRLTLVETLADSRVMAVRQFRKMLRRPAYIGISFVQPVMFALLFRYVFGGAIETGSVDYVDFLMPGVMVQTAVFGALLTGVGLSEDVKTGVVDRFRSLPIARSAVLFGRTAADMAINVLTLGVMLLVGFAVGFRPSEPVWDLGLAFVLVLAFSYVFSWISAFIGLTMREPETAQSASLLLVFPLAFASSAFVPANSMPGVVQTFAEVNPMTLMVDAARALTLGQGEALDPTPGRSPGWWGCSPCSSPGRAGVPPGLTLAFGRGADEPAPLHLRLPVAPARRVGPCPTSQRIRRIELTHLDL